MRLRTVSWQDPGWRRVRHGRGFRYLDAAGRLLQGIELQHARDLPIPPAWTDVWICAHERGHLQAVGTDAAGRRQYLYHPHWRVQRDIAKFERVTAAAAALPQMRRTIKNQILGAPADASTERDRALAVAIRLLDLGCFRIGSETSADSGSHGLTTLQRRHCRLDGDELSFRFVGKSDIEQHIRIQDPELADALGPMVAKSPKTGRLLGSDVEGRWNPITAAELNQRLADLIGADFTAKDFRTWHATTTAAATLARRPQPTTRTGCQRRIREAMAAAADLLGNTPAIARSSYVDPRVVDKFLTGTVLPRVPASQDALDRSVLALVNDD